MAEVKADVTCMQGCICCIACACVGRPPGVPAFVADPGMFSSHGTCLGVISDFCSDAVLLSWPRSSGGCLGREDVVTGA